MNHHVVRPLAVALTGAVVLLFAGCGDDDHDIVDFGCQINVIACRQQDHSACSDNGSAVGDLMGQQFDLLGCDCGACGQFDFAFCAAGCEGEIVTAFEKIGVGHSERQC